MDLNISIRMTDDEIAESLSTIDRAATQESSAIAGPFTVLVLSSHDSPASGDCRQDITTLASDNDLSGQTSDGPDEWLDTSFGNEELWWNDSNPSTGADGFVRHQLQHSNTRQSSHIITIQPGESPGSANRPPETDLSFTSLGTPSSDENSIRAESSEDLYEGVDEFVVRDYPQLQGDSHHLGTVSHASTEILPLTTLNHWCWPQGPDSSIEGQLAGPCSPSRGSGLTASAINRLSAELLVSHYTEHMLHMMQPIAHKENPFRTVYLPLAVSGLRNVQNPGKFSSASIAAFHSLLSAAAFNLQDQFPLDTNLTQLAWHHKRCALSTLASGLNSGSYKDLMTVMLFLVSTDIFHGGTVDHWVHLEAAAQLQKSRHYGNLVSRETQSLNSICTMLHLFSQTALQPSSLGPWPGAYHVPHYVSSLHSNIEFIYGITPTLARALVKLRTLSQYMTYYKDGEHPESLLQTAETLGDELHAWTVSSERFPSLQPCHSHALDIARAQARAFHSATLIYYYRSIQRCPRDCLQQEQQATIAAMNEAEDVKAACGEESYHSAPITWPAFISSCEAVGKDRHDWNDYWNRIQSYKMGNYRQQLSTILKIWSALGDGLGNTDWRIDLATMGERIIPV